MALREQLNEMADAIASAQTMTHQLEHAPDRPADPSARPRPSDVVIPPQDHRAEGVA
jgi:hypothetical protein